MMGTKNLIQSLFLLVNVLMSTVGAQEVIYAKVGESVTLVPKSSQTQVYMYWYFENKENQLAWLNPYGGKGFSEDEKWKSRLSLSGTSLVINNFQEEFFGTFVFKISTNSQTESITQYKVVQVRVSESPSPLLSGDRLDLTCNLGHNPEIKNMPNPYWLNPQNKRERNNVNIQATSEHNGQWVCVVKDDKNEKKFPVSVKVVGLAPVTSHQYTSTDSSLVVPCSVNSGVTWEQVAKKDIKKVQWHFAPKQSSSSISDNQQQLFYLDLEKLTWKTDHNKGLIPVHFKNGNLSLTRSRAKVEDRGRYTCSIKFKNGRTLNNTVDVDVLQIISHPGTELIYGQQINLSCSTGDQLPDGMMLNWTRPKTSSHYFHYSTHITIPEVGKGDNGKWRCELWRGSNKLTSAEILLKIEPKLSVWMLVIICSAAVILLLLLVLAFIHYRRRQQKMRLHRHRLCQCKNPKPKGFYRT